MKSYSADETVISLRVRLALRKILVPVCSLKIGSLSTRVFETRTLTRRENIACQDSGVSQIFIFIISNGQKIFSNVNVVV